MRNRIYPESQIASSNHIEKRQDHTKQMGLTLIEVIIASALLSIISITFLSAFTYSYTGIHSAGRRTEAVHSTKSLTEYALAQESVTGVTDTPPVTKTISITYSGAASANNFVTTGQEVTISHTIKGKTVTIVSFIPK